VSSRKRDVLSPIRRERYIHTWARPSPESRGAQFFVVYEVTQTQPLIWLLIWSSGAPCGITWISFWLFRTGGESMPSRPIRGVLGV